MFDIVYFDPMITLFLRRPTGKGQKLHISPTANLQQLIQDIKHALHIDIHSNPSEVEAYFKGERLVNDPSQSLQDVSITNNSIIHVVEKEVDQTEEEDEEAISVKLILEERLFEYQIARDQVLQVLKQNICGDLGIKNEEDLTLAYLGKELDNQKTVRQYRFPQNVLISGSVSTSIANLNQRKTYTVSKESCSEQSEGIPKIVRDPNSPKKKIKKSQSLNVEPTTDHNKPKNIFASVQLNRIEEKIDQSRNESQINESEEISEEVEEEDTDKNIIPPSKEWQKPKLTLQSLSKPWHGSQKIIETESIVDEEEEELFLECALELVRADHKREYVLSCTKEDTFEDAAQVVARLQRVEASNVRIMINFDEVSKSGISSRSSKGMCSSPKSAQLIKQRSSGALQSKDLLRAAQHKFDGMKMTIVDYATKLKKKQLSLQFQLLAEI